MLALSGNIIPRESHAKTDFPAMEEIIDMVHAGHGVAVLAHPGVNLKGKEELLEDIFKLGIDGIEAFSSYHSPEQAEKFYRAAKEHHVFATCGSDYHGKTKPSIAIGQHGCTVLEGEVEKMQKNSLRQRIHAKGQRAYTRTDGSGEENDC